MPKFLKIFKKKSKASKSEPSEKNVEPTKPTTSPSPSPSVIDPEQTVDIVGRSTNAAFQEAWRQHWKDLSKDEQVAWSRQGPRSALQMEKTVEEMDQMHRERSVARKIADRALVFLRAVESLMAGATIAAQAYPEVGSIILGVIRIVINAAVNYFEYYEKLTEMMEYLSNFLNTLDIFDGVKTNEPRLHKTLVSIYTNILSFCRYARRAYLNQGSDTSVNALAVFARVQWVPFEEQFHQIKLNLQNQTGNLNMVTGAITMKSTLALEENMIKKNSIDAKNDRRDFLNWISEADPSDMHAMISNKRYKDTGSWLLAKTTFKNWIEKKDEHILWLNGPAGTGKSILASVAINHLSECKSTNETVIYSYFKGEDEKIQHTPAQLMSSLVKQLCRNIQNLPDPVIKFHHDFRMNARRPSFYDLENLFLHCSKPFERVFVVLDGLDECEEKHRKQIMKFVCEVGVQSGNVKTFVSSRKELDISRTFGRHKTSDISSKDSLAQKDIEEFIKHQVSVELSYIEQEVQEEVIKTLTEKSNGMYLWVDLQINDLTRVPDSDIREQLKMLPAELEGTYLSIFYKMKSLPKTSKSLIQTCFLWALYSEKVMESEEFLYAVSLKHKMAPEQEKPYDLKTIREMTFGLITIDDFWFSDVRPVHFSLQEFYKRPSQKHPPDLQEVLPDSDTANAKMAIMCLQHLMVDAVPDFLSNCMDYCSWNFDIHIQNLAAIPEEVWNMLDYIFIKNPRSMRKILARRYPSEFNNYPDWKCIGNPRIVDPFMFMRFTKLHQIPAIWSRYKGTDETPRDYPKDCIYLAAINGCDEILQNIISQGVNVNKATRDRMTALHYALDGISHSVSCVEILLNAGADWNFNGKASLKIYQPSPFFGEYATPLNAAISSEKYSAVRLIVKNESFNFATYMKTIPPECAGYIKHLVLQGADISQRDEYGDTALQIAREDGREDCVKVLEELGAVE